MNLVDTKNPLFVSSPVQKERSLLLGIYAHEGCQVLTILITDEKRNLCFVLKTHATKFSRIDVYSDGGIQLVRSFARCDVDDFRIDHHWLLITVKHHYSPSTRKWPTRPNTDHQFWFWSGLVSVWLEDHFFFVRNGQD